LTYRSPNAKTARGNDKINQPVLTTTNEPRTMFHTQRVLLSSLLLSSLVLATMALPTSAQSADQRAGQILEEPPATDPTPAANTAAADQQSINVLELIWAARWLMLPILIMSVVVVAVGIERALALRRHQIAPPELVAQIDGLSSTSNLEPRRLVRACTAHPSALATVTQEILRKLGRPQTEVETTATHVMQRESERLYRNVRTLNLAAAVTPLMGLLGTVWGMIAAFFATANLPVGANKAESLAEGIYIALVTTAAGLVVAIPAAMLAHWLEGRIQKSFLDMEELLGQRLFPQTARLEGRAVAPAARARPAGSSPIPPPAPVSPSISAK
jgi:biopolymer transport protein ExbB